MTQPKLSYLNLYTTDPAWNLAAEQYVFDALPRDRTYFMLWQNDNAIIIGKHQNAAAEINQQFVRENGVRVVRRLSGGGAVYHDLGNLNFPFSVCQVWNFTQSAPAFFAARHSSLARSSLPLWLTPASAMM